MSFKIPNKEILWLQWLDENDNTTYIITSDTHRDSYKLYQVNGDNIIYTKHKSDDPRELEKWCAK
jgi:hypothetical protein